MPEFSFKLYPLSLNNACLHTRKFWMCTAHDLRRGIHGSSWLSLWDTLACGMCQAASGLCKSTAKCRFGIFAWSLVLLSVQRFHKYHINIITNTFYPMLLTVGSDHVVFCKGMLMYLHLNFLRHWKRITCTVWKHLKCVPQMCHHIVLFSLRCKCQRCKTPWDCTPPCCKSGECGAHRTLGGVWRKCVCQRQSWKETHTLRNSRVTICAVPRILWKWVQPLTQAEDTPCTLVGCVHFEVSFKSVAPVLHYAPSSQFLHMHFLGICKRAFLHMFIFDYEAALMLQIQFYYASGKGSLTLCV